MLYLSYKEKIYIQYLVFYTSADLGKLHLIPCLCDCKIAGNGKNDHNTVKVRVDLYQS